MRTRSLRRPRDIMRIFVLSVAAATVQLSKVHVRAQGDLGYAPLATCNVGRGAKKQSCWCVPTKKDGSVNLAARCQDPKMKRHRNLKNNLGPAKKLKTWRRRLQSNEYSCLEDEKPTLNGCNPFGGDDCPKPTGHDNPKAVCGIIYADPAIQGGKKCASGRRYGLRTFENMAALKNYGKGPNDKKGKAILTHTGHCGVCSSQQDLFVFINQPKASTYIADCGRQIATAGGVDAIKVCLQCLGHTEECALLWAQSMEYAFSINECFLACGPVINDSAALVNDPDKCVKHSCLTCREDNTDEVMLTHGGRSLTNSAIRSAQIEPCGKLKGSKKVAHNPCVNHHDPTITCGGHDDDDTFICPEPADTARAADDVFQHDVRE